MKSYKTADWVDVLAMMGVLLGIAAKATLVPGTGIVCSFLLISAAGWYGSRMVGAINNSALRGIPKLLMALIWLGLLFNSMGILLDLGSPQSGNNALALGAIGWVVYIAWLRQPPAQRPQPTGVYLFPILGLLALGVWLLPPQDKYAYFNPTSPYVSYADYTRGYHLSGGYLVDSAGKQIKAVPYLK
jgi:hypothetical protein